MKTYTLYTDGSSKFQNTKDCIGSIGIVIYDDGEILEHSKVYKNITSNEAELKAVVEGLKMIEEPSKVTIISDSFYVVGNITTGKVYRWRRNNWKKKNKKNICYKEVWGELLELLEYHEVEFVLVKSHRNNNGNNLADSLCTKAINEYLEKWGR